MTNPDSRNLPTRWTTLWLEVRKYLLSGRRIVEDSFVPDLRRWRHGRALIDAPIVAQIRSPLWDEGRPDEFLLLAGKVENLRIARAAFHAIEVPPGGIMSFWQQLGRPVRRRGFVLGREIRHGCVVPAIAGGICQISNALLRCALQAGLEVVERHSHSATIQPGDSTPTDRDQADATVSWNYVDLRLRDDHAWRIELEIGSDEMALTIRSRRPECNIPQRSASQRSFPIHHSGTRPTARSCLTCQQISCHQHRPDLAGSESRFTTEAWLLDSSVRTPEFQKYLDERGADTPRVVLKSPTHHVGAFRPKSVLIAAYWRWRFRFPGRHGIHARRLDHAESLARAYARTLAPQHVRLIVSQTLLPFLWELGVLAGRRYEVLAHALPMREIECRLDRANRLWPTESSLAMFRAPDDLVRAELAALRHAARIVTAHPEVAAEIAKLRQEPADGARISVLPWVLPAHQPMPAVPEDRSRRKIVVMPASALARKGARELAEALRGLPCELWVLGTVPQSWFSAVKPDVVKSIDPQEDWLAHATVVVLPAHVEHSPRAALTAIAAGLPVVASTACGLDGLPGVTSVPAGDVEALRRALSPYLSGADEACALDIE
ncbi:VanW family protein [Burkholderia sp. SRS-W-2-2016]|uniref:VanW family protein n=1 Tax=Burkholderia sp. SRS-W-2-2016 TaxID=1926878 RepID=UPI00094AFF42|nr:VanW family protein [Burkholderia sp. SRS-W-2-2016]